MSAQSNPSCGSLIYSRQPDLWGEGSYEKMEGFKFLVMPPSRGICDLVLVDPAFSWTTQIQGRTTTVT